MHASWGAALFAILFLVLSSGRASVRWATLQAIHQLENPRNLSRPGPHGELGAYQFRASTWRLHTSVPFARAIDKRASDAVAVKHYDWLKRGLERSGLPANPYYIALAWNGGLSAAVKGSSPRAACEYAERTANLAACFDRSLVAATR
jgi:hypothetical protein